MFSSMVGTLSVAMLLAALVMLVALFTEGRGRHLLRLVFALRERPTVDTLFSEVARDEGDWELVADVNSRPDRPSPGVRAASWASTSASKATHAITERAQAWSQPHEASEGPQSGELSLAQR